MRRMASLRTPPVAIDPMIRRFAPAMAALAAFAPLLVASTLRPAEAGMGTHTQLGLAPCGFLAATGLPCATCGMTTAFAHATNGDLISAFVVQPAGAFLALFCAVVCVSCTFAAFRGSDLAPLGRALWRPRTILAFGAVVVAGWAYTIARTYAGS